MKPCSSGREVPYIIKSGTYSLRIEVMGDKAEEL